MSIGIPNAPGTTRELVVVPAAVSTAETRVAAPAFAAVNCTEPSSPGSPVPPWTANGVG